MKNNAPRRTVIAKGQVNFRPINVIQNALSIEIKLQKPIQYHF